jgi:polyphosphate kinase
MTLYRTSRDSRIVQALGRAALSGKYVTAVVELKARFDEARNIRWARELEENGVQVIHGVRGLKTHAKICLIVRREATGTVRYLHFGTGNYNESTARQYADISLLTSNELLGRDATVFFNAVTGYSVERTLQALAMAPSGLRQRLLELIRQETVRRRDGQRAEITAKMNSLVDRSLIDALYEASQAGVRIRLNVRGICCLRPGVPGLSDNITVVSIVDRFLEHSRVFHFAHGGEDLVFISSADWMPRNLDRRVELLVPVADSGLRQRLLRLLDVCCGDRVKGREILADGSYRLPPPDSSQNLSSQERLYRDALAVQRDDLQRQRTAFEPREPARSDGPDAEPRGGARNTRAAGNRTRRRRRPLPGA